MSSDKRGIQQRSSSGRSDSASKEGVPGRLYLVATPIGNLEDITLRALKILRQVSIIATEDTRRALKLINAYGINTPLLQYSEQGRARKGSRILKRLEEGQDVALISGAGTPVISDPGYELVRMCQKHSIDVVPVPGPTALIAAMCASGLPADRFLFVGFLPRKKQQRLRRIHGLSREKATLIFYESPRRLQAALKELHEILGERQAVVARELTKMHEEIRKGSLKELSAAYQEQTVRGEVTLLVEGWQDSCREADAEDSTIEERLRFLKEECGLSGREAAVLISKEWGISKKRIYKVIESMRPSH